jgi:hypothetical protein
VHRLTPHSVWRVFDLVNKSFKKYSKKTKKKKKKNARPKNFSKALLKIMKKFKALTKNEFDFVIVYTQLQQLAGEDYAL